MSKVIDKEIKHHDNSCGVAGVILGILSLALCLIPFAGLIFGIVGIVFAYNQNKSMRNNWSKAGLWLCGIGIVLGSTWTIYYVIAVIKFASTQVLGANAGALG